MSLKGSELLERLVRVEGSASALHVRVDKVEAGIRADLDDIKTGLTDLRGDLKEVIAWMNRGKGWAAAGMVMAGVLGGLAAKFIGGFRA